MLPHVAHFVPAGKKKQKERFSLRNLNRPFQGGKPRHGPQYERREHEATIKRLRTEYDRLQNRTYATFFEKMSRRVARRPGPMPARYRCQKKGRWRRFQRPFRDLAPAAGLEPAT